MKAELAKRDALAKGRTQAGKHRNRVAQAQNMSRARRPSNQTQPIRKANTPPQGSKILGTNQIHSAPHSALTSTTTRELSNTPIESNSTHKEGQYPTPKIKNPGHQ